MLFVARFTNEADVQWHNKTLRRLVDDELEPRCLDVVDSSKMQMFCDFMK